jgi:hypothetical protein
VNILSGGASFFPYQLPGPACIAGLGDPEPFAAVEFQTAVRKIRRFRMMKAGGNHADIRAFPGQLALHPGLATIGRDKRARLPNAIESRRCGIV